MALDVPVIRWDHRPLPGVGLCCWLGFAIQSAVDCALLLGKVASQAFELGKLGEAAGYASWLDIVTGWLPAWARPQVVFSNWAKL